MMNPQAAPASRRTRRRLMSSGAMASALGALLLFPATEARASLPGFTSAFQGTPQVVSGGASVVQTPTVDTIRVTTPQAVINWTPNDRNGNGTIDFLPNGLRAEFLGDVDFTILNRIIPVDGQDIPVARMIALNGQIISRVNGQAGGNVWFYSPGGILVGSRSLINVGSLLLTSRDIDTTGGLFGSNGEIRFRNPSIAGAQGPVQIDAGAFILANGAVSGSAYVAVVAPSIVQAGTIRADGSVALVAAEQADIRINQGLFDINVLVGTDDPHGIIHTGSTGGPSDTSGTYESRAYLVAVPKNQAITMLLSGTVGFETASSVSIDANGGIVLSAGHNVAGGAVAGRAPGTGAGNMSITDSSFRNNLDATATGTIIGRPNQSCQPFCDNSPSGQLLFNGNATLNGAAGVSLSIGQAQQIVVNGNLSLLSATPGQGGSASLTIDNVSPPSSSSGNGIASITGALLIDASARGNPASESGAATGGTASLSVNNGSLSAASISVQADATGVLGGSTSGGSGTGGTALLNVENGGSISSGSFLRISADGRGGGVGIDAAQNPVLPANGGTGRGGSATLVIDNAQLFPNDLSVTANGFGAAGTTTSGDGFGGSADVSIDNDGGTTTLSATSLQVAARGAGGGSGFDPVSFQSISTADGGNGTGGTARITLTDTTSRDVNIGFALVDAGATGGVAQSSSQTPFLAAGGNAQGGTATYTMNGATSAANIQQLTVASAAQGGSGLGTLGRGGNATGGTSNIMLDSGATLINSNTQSTFGGTRVSADGFGGVGQDRSGNGSGGSAGMTVASGVLIETDVIELTASGIGGGGGQVQQSFTPVTTIGGNGSGGTVLLTSAGTVVSEGIELDANGFGGNSNPGAGAVSVSTGGSAIGGTARIAQSAGSIAVVGSSIRANATAGSSATGAGSSGASQGGNASLGIAGGTFTSTGNLSVEARAYVRSGPGTQLAQTGGTSGITVSTGELSVDGTVSIDASAGITSFASLAAQSQLITGGSTSLEADNAATVTAGSLLLLSSASGGIGFGSGANDVGARASGGTSKLRAASGATVEVTDSFRLDASGAGGFAARGGSGDGGTVELEIDGGSLTLNGPAQLNASGVSGFSFGQDGSTSATGGDVTIAVTGAAGSAFKFASLAVAATAESAVPLSPAARGGPAPVVASDAIGGSVSMLIDGGTTTGNQLTVSADAYGSNGGDGTGGSASFTQTGGTAQLTGVSLTADGFGGSSPPALETGTGPVVGGTGRGGTATVELTGGTITATFFSASASGTGGSGYTAFTSNGEGGFGNGEGGFGNGEGGLLLPGDGGDGFGGSVEVLIDGEASASLGTAFFSAFGRGGNGGNFIAVGEGAIYTPGSGGTGTGGNVFVDIAGGELFGAVFASAGSTGGDGGRFFNLYGDDTEFAGSPDDPQPAGGDAVGGFAEIRLATTVSASLSADATAGAGEGGTAMAGARGGDATGGFARILVDDGVDAGSIDISLSAAGFGGRGGRAQHGDGGDGGSGTGGTTAFDLANGAIADVLGANFDARGVGGDGRAGFVNSNLAPVATGFNGGDGGTGTGGTIAIGVTDADLELSAGNGEGIILESYGFGGFGGNGANNIEGDPGIGTFGGTGGNGGNGRGGTINLSASGGTISVLGGAGTEIVATGEGGIGGLGGAGNAVSQTNPMTGVTTTTGGNGGNGFTGLQIGGNARLEAHDTESGAGLIDLSTLSVIVSGQIGGRVELIDDTAGPGLTLGDLSVDNSGSPAIGSDFSLVGSGVYVSSRDAAIIVGNSLNLAVSGIFQVDANDTGGLAVDGDLTVGTDFGIVARHNERDGTATISANNIQLAAPFIDLQNGTQLHAIAGSISLFSSSFINFDELLSVGSIVFEAGSDVNGDEADADGVVFGTADGAIDIDDIDTSGSVTLTAGGALRVGSLDTEFGYAELTGSQVTLEEGGIGSYLAVRALGGSATIGDVTAASEASVDASADIDIGRLTTTGLGGSQTSSAPGGANIRLTAGGQITLGTLDSAQNIFIDAGSLTQQTGGESGGSPSNLFADGDIEIDVSDSAVFGLADGGFVDVDAGNGILFDSVVARSGVELQAGSDITGNSIFSDGQIFASSGEGSIDIDTSTASGNIAILAAEGNVIGDFAESRFGSIIIRAIDVDFGELYANSVIDIVAQDDVDLAFAQTGGEGCGTFGCGEGGFDQFDDASSLGLTPTGSDILIEAGDTVTLGTLDAADSIVIQAGALAGATSSLTAGKQLTAAIANDAVFGSLLSGGNMALTAGGTATGQSAETTGSGTDLALSATNGLTIGSIRAAGTTDLAASAGAVMVANLRSVGVIDANGRSVTVSGGTGPLDFQTLRATAGDARVTVGSGDLVVRSGSASGTLSLTTQNGAIETRGVQGGTVTIDSSRGATLNNATTATGTLGVTARNTATVNGVASGGTVRITSGDIVIASGGRVGTGGTTTDVLLVNGDGTRRTFVGGTGSTAGYSLSADEMTRLFGGNITIRAPRVSISSTGTASAPGTSVIAPSGEPDLTIDAFSINGGGGATGNLGGSGILRIETPGFARVIGAAQVTNAAPTNSFVVSADRSLQVMLGSGSLRISGGSGLVGSLRLISEDVVVATASAIADIAVAPDMAAIDERLAQNDGVLSEEGALSGGTIRFDVGNGLYIQNSGNGDGFEDRRGFTAGSGGVSIFTGTSSSTAGGSTRLVINGRTTGDTGEILTGIDAFTRISVNQTLLTGESQTVGGIDAGSTVNGCLIVSASNCFAFEIDLVPPVQDNPLVDLDDEESEQTGGGDPLDVTTIVEIEDIDRMSNEPVVDEPVTGSGNDDLWTPTEPEEDEDD